MDWGYVLGAGSKDREPRKAVGLHLDIEVINYYKAVAKKLGLPYQSVINLALRHLMREKFELVIKSND
jgi:uncharacterized protein (DUF4415 family)